MARVTLLDCEGHSCLETLVKPSSPILDYKTSFSRITKDILRGVSTTFSDVQGSLIERVSVDDILVGHSIDNDLRCLHLEHRKVTNTLCKIHAFSWAGRQYFKVFLQLDGPHQRHSLKFLAEQHLSRYLDIIYVYILASIRAYVLVSLNFYIVCTSLYIFIYQ